MTTNHELQNKLLQIDLEDWPNCSVPDCEYKACLALNSDRCYPHTVGEIPPILQQEQR